MVALQGEAVVGDGEKGLRLDVFVAGKASVSRNRAQLLISGGLVRVDSVAARKNHTVSTGEVVSWEIPEREPEGITPQEIPLNVVHEDGSIIVIDKPPGMAMYPGPGHRSDTLLNAILARFPEVAAVGGEGRPGVFHRLDRDTSGLVAVARTEAAYQKMVENMKARLVERLYMALVTGDLPAGRGVIDAPMGRSPGNRKRMSVRPYGGRKAVTRFTVLERFPAGYTLVEVSLETGRTHQIRVHFSHIGHPVAGDPEYSRGRARRELGLERQFLHACSLTFPHPASRAPMRFESDLPPDLVTVLERLRAFRA